jgi:hypothetical protein
MSDYLTDAQNDIKTYFETHDIPIRFYQCFFGELVKVFGVKFLIPDASYLDNYEEDEDYSYKEQLGYYLNSNGGTGGWNLAFKEACDQCGIMDIYDDYSNMDWVRSDIFDGYIADKMLDVLFDDTRHNDYYKFKMQKENEL